MFKRTICGVATVSVLASALIARAEDPAGSSSAPQPKPRPTVEQLSAQAQKDKAEPAEGRDARKPADALINDIDAVLPRSEYWLGVLLSPPSADLQKQFQLPKDRGLFVERVEVKSPATDAGIKPSDVLLKANDNPVADIGGFMKLINEVKDGKLTLQLLRDGKEQTVVATLAKRPDWARQPLAPEAQAWIEMAPRGGFMVVGPGQIVPSDAHSAGDISKAHVEVTIRVKAELADGSQVEITREDGKPAKVIVTQGKDRWEGTSEDLSKIPEKIRPEVERLVRSKMDRINLLAAPGPVGTLSIGGMPNAIAVVPSVEKRLSEMQKQIDELKQQLKTLQDNDKAKKD